MCLMQIAANVALCHWPQAERGGGYKEFVSSLFKLQILALFFPFQIQLTQFIRFYETLSGVMKGFIYNLFTYAIVLPKTCKQTLMCKFGGVSL